MDYVDSTNHTNDSSTAVHFSHKFGKPVTRHVIRNIMRNRSKLFQKDPETRSRKEQELMTELNTVLTHKMSLNDSPKNPKTGRPQEVTSHRSIASLAYQLASQDKYEGFFANHKFNELWTKNFREIYHLPVNSCKNKNNKHPMELELMTELFNEVTLRMSLSNSSEINSQQMITSLALELAAHEKYEGFFRCYKFGYTWTRTWRELMNIPANPKSNQYT